MENVITAQSMLDSIASRILKTSSDSKDVYRIGDLATEFDISLRTLRFYEDRGLISPERSGSTRLYSPEDRTRLKVIILAKNVGFSLVDIQEILKIYDGDSVSGEANSIREKFQSQLDSLKIQKSQIERSIVDLHNAIDTIEHL